MTRLVISREAYCGIVDASTAPVFDHSDATPVGDACVEVDVNEVTALRLAKLDPNPDAAIRKLLGLAQ